MPLPLARPALLAFLSLAAIAPAQAEDVIKAEGISPFGALKYPPGFDHFDYVDPAAPKGGTMSFRGTAASGTFDSLNAFILDGEPAQGLGKIYDTLLTEAADEPGAMYGLLAESLEYPPDRSWVIFNLRPEATFSDGVPVTADDVVWTFDALRKDGHPAYAIMLDGIASVEALDPHRVKFTFAPGIALRDMPANVGTTEILPKHYYQTHDFAKSTMEIPIGSGPYIIDRADPGRSIRYCRNPNYWGADLPVNKGDNNFDCFVYEYFGDTTAAFEALKSGQYLFHEEFSSKIWSTEYDFPALTKGWVVKEQIPDLRPSGAQGFWLNLRRPQLQDIRVREAIAQMFNFEWTNASLFYGLYTRTDSFWEGADTMQAKGVPEGAELAALEKYKDQLPPEILTEPAYEPPVWSDRQTDRAALRAASALLDEAGWHVGSDGMRRNDKGETLKLEFVDDNPSGGRYIDPFVQNLRAVGIDAVLTIVDYAQMQERQENFDYDVYPARLPMSLAPSVELRTFFGSKGADAKGTLNLSGLADPVVDGLIEDVIAADSRDEMEARVRALDRVMRARQIWVPNWYSGFYRVAYWDIFGKPAPKPIYARGDSYWWTDQGKLDKLRAEGALR